LAIEVVIKILSAVRFTSLEISKKNPDMEILFYLEEEN
jgi:hypothetical protein